MDWTGLHADKNKWMNKHYDRGRRSKIRRVVIHHNAGVRMSTEDCWRVWQTRKASAHYQVEADGTIGQLVHDRDTAWQASGANSDGIGVEHANISGAPGWGISDATVEAGAHLVAALCRAYGLGRPTWMVNVFPHSHYNATACPGLLAGPLRDRYMARAQYWYDQMTGQAHAAGGDTAQDPASSGLLEVDGKAEPATVRRAQQLAGTPVDGVITGQSTANKPYHHALYSIRYGRGGSALVGAIQRALGVPVDYHLGPVTIAAMQRALGVTPDKHFGPATASAWQRRLNSGRLI